MAGGDTGKYCIVDLSTGNTEIVEPGDGFYRKYLSGYGLGAAVIMDRQQAGIDPLSPASYLGICSGLLTGTGARFSGRFMVVGKSPLTGGLQLGWGKSAVGQCMRHVPVRCPDQHPAHRRLDECRHRLGPWPG